MKRVWPVATLVLFVAGSAFAGESVGELREKFDVAVAAQKPAEAQVAGKRLLAEFPEDAAALHVLRTYHEQGWKWPRLETSLATLRGWETDLPDREADFRLALVEEIERLFPRSDAVQTGGTLYERIWCHLQARRYDVTIQLGKDFLRRFADSKTVDKVKWAMAQAHLGRSPPDLEDAKKLLQWLATEKTSRYRELASRRLDDLRAGTTWIEVGAGLPRAEGLGKVAVVTDWAEASAHWKALEGWRRARSATVVRFRSGRLAEVVDDLRKLGPEFVAFAVSPATVDINFHWNVLEICRALDDDPLPDFHFGYLVARDAEDLASLGERSLRASKDAVPKLATAAVPASPDAVKDLDGFIHYGHGTPTGILGGLDAEALSGVILPRAPVVFSGACFNGVLSRSYHDSLMVPVVRPPAEYAPSDLLSLAWIHAGATAVVAALEGDRGEMAAVEWAYLRETAATLGEAVGQSYLLAFTSLPEVWTGFPRYKVGGPRSQSLYDVMLRGQTSRILVGDPAAKPFATPVDRRSVASEATWSSGALTVSVRIAPDANFANAQYHFHNTLTTSGMSAPGFTERRLFGRVELPSEVGSRPGEPDVKVTAAGRAIVPSRVVVRQEVWGRRRFLCLQVESADSALASAGAHATFTFPPGR